MTGDVQYDIERIGSICSDIRRYLVDLEQLNIGYAGDLSDKRNFYAVSMILFSLLNRVLDLGNEVTIAHNLGIPKSYRDIFILLWKNGFIDEKCAKEMGRLVTYRNLLSHEYQGITPEKVFELTKKVNTIKKFARFMQEKVKEQ
ncbi:MAG: hypothetical protein XE10_2023 [Methanoculleus marisnigri]|jgi:uncharacterized protein YutE (UPF0331/DUF86 family)|uniref:DUF86 domain-containing protein n=1 Tax=Methanoculleus marisnigri TaxID=2198 RepID=A0A101INX6_9EURY|nr:DUF86 domain-containing protein [Methanoculleus marisnigri]KUK98553.1 MAG: hypothetical protein XE10_2023 [Methanoculleus marisnigri]